jgi:hypothetical protein
VTTGVHTDSALARGSRPSSKITLRDVELGQVLSSKATACAAPHIGSRSAESPADRVADIDHQIPIAQRIVSVEMAGHDVNSVECVLGWMPQRSLAKSPLGFEDLLGFDRSRQTRFRPHRMGLKEVILPKHGLALLSVTADIST